MEKRITQITMQEYQTDKVSVYLEARIDEDGSLILSGQDIGKSVEEHWGDPDYEYLLLVKKHDKEAIPLQRIKERFARMSDFISWLDEKDIPRGGRFVSIRCSCRV